MFFFVVCDIVMIGGDYMTIGNNIAKYRKLEGLTQKELAEKCNCATGTIQQYELGTREPSIEKLSAIAKILHIPIEYLLPDNVEEVHTVIDVDMTQINNRLSHNDKDRFDILQKVLLDNGYAIVKNDDFYILQKHIGIYEYRIKISVLEYDDLLRDFERFTNFFIDFTLNKLFASHKYYSNVLELSNATWFK